MPDEENVCDLSSSSPTPVCGNQDLLNTLDGFSENPRIMVCFSGPVDTNTLRSGIFILPAKPRSSGYQPVAINQVIYDDHTNCAYAKPDQVLAQDTTYLLLATSAIRDANGSPVSRAPEFDKCLATGSPYCTSLRFAVSAPALQSQFSDIAGASVFTTMSATAWAQAARSLVSAAPSHVTPAGPVSTFDVSDISSLTWNTAQSAAPTSQPIPLSVPDGAGGTVNVLDGVGKVAFGLFTSLNFLDPGTGTINFGRSSYLPVGSVPTPTDVSFHVFLPEGTPPPGGFPVVLWGHGLGDHQFGASTFAASTLAKNGFATLTIEVTGQGFGKDSTVTVSKKNGESFTEATPGRGVLLPGKTTIGSLDGCVLIGSPIGTRDCNLQSVADLSAITHALRTSAVQTTLGLDLDPNRIYYIGQSEGAMFGTLFSAVEPNIQAVALSGGGGTSVDIARTAITGRLLAVAYGQANRLLNVIPPVVAPPQCPYYDPLNDNYVFRDQPGVNSPSQPSSTGLCPVSVPETGVKVNHVPGAIVVQAGFESADWLQMLGDPLSFASHLKLDPLPGNTPKPVLFLFAEGDPEVPNPANSAFIRAAGIADRSWLLQSHQLVNPQLSPTYPVVKTNIPNVFVLNPHRLLSNPDVFSDPGQRSIALAEQQQVADFLNSDGTTNLDPNGVLTGPFKESDKLFVVPQSLPDELNYLPVPAPPSNQQ